MEFAVGFAILPGLQELGKIRLQESSGGNFYNFTQQYVDGKSSSEWNSTAKVLMHKIVITPTSTLRKPD